LVQADVAVALLTWKVAANNVFIFDEVEVYQTFLLGGSANQQVGLHEETTLSNDFKLQDAVRERHMYCLRLVVFEDDRHLLRNVLNKAIFWDAMNERAYFVFFCKELHEQNLKVTVRIIFQNFNNARRELQINHVQKYFGAAYLERLTSVQLLWFVVLELDESSMSASHVLNIEVSRFPQVADHKHSQFRRQIHLLWIPCHVLLAKQLEELQVEFRYHSLATKFLRETILVDYSTMDSAHSEVVMSHQDVIWL
jgi:hypothetical protein